MHELYAIWVFVWYRLLKQPLRGTDQKVSPYLLMELYRRPLTRGKVADLILFKNCLLSEKGMLTLAAEAATSTHVRSILLLIGIREVGRGRTFTRTVWAELSLQWQRTKQTIWDVFTLDGTGFQAAMREFSEWKALHGCLENHAAQHRTETFWDAWLDVLDKDGTDPTFTLSPLVSQTLEYAALYLEGDLRRKLITHLREWPTTGLGLRVLTKLSVEERAHLDNGWRTYQDLHWFLYTSDTENTPNSLFAWVAENFQHAGHPKRPMYQLLHTGPLNVSHTAWAMRFTKIAFTVYHRELSTWTGTLNELAEYADEVSRRLNKNLEEKESFLVFHKEMDASVSTEELLQLCKALTR